MSRRPLSALFLVPTLLVARSYSVIRDGQLDRTRAERIEQGVMKLRGLPLRHPVPMQVKTPVILAQNLPVADLRREPQRVVSEGTEPYWLEQDGTRVLLILGLPPSETAERARGIWQKTTFAPFARPIPLDLAQAGK